MKTYQKLFFVIAMLAAPAWLLAQEEQNKNEAEASNLERDPRAREKIEATRIGMITNRLALTPAQAEKFWPIYREFSEKRMDLRKEFKSEQDKVKPESVTPEQQKRLVELGLNLKQKELDLEKTYSGKLLGVISADQMLNLRAAERDFHRMIINQLQQRREMQQRKENFRDRNQNLRQKRN